MQKLLTISSALAALALSSPAMAGGDYCYVPMSQWQTRAAAIRWAEAQGWQVQRIKIEDGCYELYATEKNEVEFEAKLNPATLEIIKLEYEPHGLQTRIESADQGDEHPQTESD